MLGIEADIRRLDEELEIQETICYVSSEVSTCERPLRKLDKEVARSGNAVSVLSTAARRCIALLLWTFRHSIQESLHESSGSE